MARAIAGAFTFEFRLNRNRRTCPRSGTSPFGHTGEDALNDLMAPFGGFEHNAQALRIVTMLERHYADFDGMNLTWEKLEGIAKYIAL